VPLNPAYHPAQTLAALNHVSASCLVISKEITLPHKEPRPTTELLNEITVSNVPSLQRILLINNSRGGRPVDVPTLSIIMDYDLLLTTHRGLKFPVRDYLHVDDVVNIQFTSGTTSAPKAACLTHRNILNNGFFVGEGMELTEHDIICCPPPLYHCFGLILGLLASMTHGKISSPLYCGNGVLLKEVPPCCYRRRVSMQRRH
jgi:acyl-CoA synthetase (AMP-forming)/AMP-acid ligase II